ncbi:MAG: class I SAM-dependent methyltransferase [Bacteroidota bacterium]
MAKIQPFEEFTQEYEDWFTKNNNIYQSELNAIKEFILSNKDGIEIGIGAGKFAIPLGIKTGIDPSPKMAEMARNKGLEVVEAVAEDLPFEDEKFDFALMVTAICFFDDVQQAFKEAYRVLKPDGFIVIGLIDKNSELGRIYEKNKAKSKFYNEASFHSVDEISEYLKNAGFKEFKYKQTIFTPENIVQDVQDGYGEGSFVAIKAVKI